MMKKIIKLPFLTILFICTVFFTSCSSENNDLITGPSDDTNYELIVTPYNTNVTSERNLEIEVTPNIPVEVNVSFTSLENMYRLYVTKNIYGSDEGAVAYEFIDVVDTKADGSLDLGSDDKTEFTFNINFEAPTALDETVEYKLWATTGRGDFRDASKRNAIADNAYGTITLKGGTTAPSNNSVDMKSFSTVILAAPLADGTSKTFISLFDEQIYAIDEGEEYAAFWDFGYYYGANSNASFASAANYPTDIVNVPVISNTTELNNFYFALSSYTTAQFDAITSASELDFITQPSTERVTGLNVGDVIEFVDAYGNKGLIKVTTIEGTYNFGDYIEFDVKVQVNAEPIIP